MTAKADSTAASVFVRVSQLDAFQIFTEELDQWWRHGKKFRIAGKRPGQLVLECQLGGRLFEKVELANGPKLFVVGTVIEWQPSEGFAFEWRQVNFRAHEKTLVRVTFAQLGEGTMVRVEHTGLSRLPDEHPARHGKLGADYCRAVGMWWGELLSALREFTLERSGHE